MKKKNDESGRKIGDLGVKPTLDSVEPVEGMGATSERRFIHNGHECVIETHYKILVDDEELGGHLMVD